MGEMDMASDMGILMFFSGNSFLFLFSILFRNQDVLAKTTEIWSIPTPSNVEIKNINLPKSRK